MEANVIQCEEACPRQELLGLAGLLDAELRISPEIGKVRPDQGNAASHFAGRSILCMGSDQVLCALKQRLNIIQFAEASVDPSPVDSQPWATLGDFIGNLIQPGQIE